MKTARIASGVYTVTGHTMTGSLVQYEIIREGSGWHTIGWIVHRVYGQGADLHQRLFSTKADAIKAIKTTNL